MDHSARRSIIPETTLRQRRRAVRKPAVNLKPLMEGLEDRIVLSTFTWNGKGDGTTFSLGTNWVGSAAPDTGDDAVINVGGNPTIQLPSGGATVHSLAVIGATLALSGGTLATTTGLSLSSATFDFTGGSITGSATLASSTLNPRHGVAGAASFLVGPGNSSVSGPIAANESIVVAGGSLNGTAAANLTLASGATNLGTITLQPNGTTPSGGPGEQPDRGHRPRRSPTPARSRSTRERTAARPPR